MKNRIQFDGFRGITALVAALILAVLACAEVFAGGTPQTLPLMPNGSGSALELGNAISVSAALGEPLGLPQLNVSSCNSATCSDCAWTNLFSSDHSWERTAETVRDEFTNPAYSGNHGTQNWSTDRVENDGGGLTGGANQIVGVSPDFVLGTDVAGPIAKDADISLEVHLEYSLMPM